ncbi:MAG: monomethylamine:corrinoid methyltransferase [Deltaproteobacteria bacterium]|nr:monomethylamine:corrinoid methyltransferase [Deltaproteobacteria bacterium]
MITLNDCLERSLTGPVMREKDFDLKVSARLRELYGDFNIPYDPDKVIPDEKIADAVFEAAVQLLIDVGLYNKDSQRVIQFSRDEILEIAKTRCHEITLGKGHDAVLVRERKPDSDFPPVIVTGPIGGPFTEECYLPCHISYAREPTCQGLLGGVLMSYQGVQNMAGRPNELIVTRAEGHLINQAAVAAGKPNLYLGVFPPGGIAPEAIFCQWSAEGIAPERGQIAIQLMPELKLNWSKLNLALFCRYHGIHPWTDIVSVIGAFCRNPVESSIAQTAGVLGTFAFDHGSTASIWTTTIDGLCTKKQNLWANCATTRALERGVGNPVFLLGYASAGPCTEMVLYETSAYTIAYTISGGELIWGGSSCNGVEVNSYAGMQGRMVGETARASCGIGIERANRIINGLFALYEKDLPNAPKGIPFDQCYDLKTIKPTGEYVVLYNKTKETLNNRFDINYKY